jgi:hypothetical protein
MPLGGTTDHEEDSRGRGFKDSSERHCNKTLEPSNPGILDPYFYTNGADTVLR